MANINLIEFPITEEINFCSSGRCGTENVQISFDPVDSPIIFTFNSEILSTSKNRSNIILSPTFSIITLGGVVLPENATYTIFGEVFTSKTLPTQPNQFFASPFSINTNISKIIAQSLSDAINSNVNLNWRYTANIEKLTNDFWVVKLQARFQGTQYNILNSFSTNGFGVNTTPSFQYNVSTDANRGMKFQKFNFGCWVEVFIPDNQNEFGRRSFADQSNGRTIAKLSKFWTSENEFSFDISQYLKSELDYFVPSAENTQPIFTKIPKQIVNYYLRYGEKFSGGIDFTTGNPILPTDSIIRNFLVDVTPSRWATHGVYTSNINPANNVGYWLTESNLIQNKLKFLNGEPFEQIRRRSKNVSEPYYLSILGYNKQDFSNVYTLRLNVEHYSLDGSLISAAARGQSLLNSNDVYYLNISDAVLGIPNIENNEQIYYTIYWVEQNRGNGFQQYSDKYTWYWDLVRGERKDYTRIYWRNKVGQISQFDFEGQITQKLDLDSIEYESSLSLKQGINRKDGQLQILQRQVVEETTVNSGLVNFEIFEWLKELAESTDVYIYKLLPITQRSGSNLNIVTENVFDFEKIKINDFNWKFDNDLKKYNVELTYVESTETNTRSK
jgi:hypothetical protein